MGQQRKESFVNLLSVLILLWVYLPPVYAAGPPIAPPPPSQETLDNLKRMGDENLKQFGSGIAPVVTTPIRYITPTNKPIIITQTATPSKPSSTSTPSPIPSPTAPQYSPILSITPIPEEKNESCSIVCSFRNAVQIISSSVIGAILQVFSLPPSFLSSSRQSYERLAKATVKEYFPAASVSLHEYTVRVQGIVVDSRIIETIIDVCLDPRMQRSAKMDTSTLLFSSSTGEKQYACSQIRETKLSTGSRSFAVWDVSYMTPELRALYAQYLASLGTKRAVEIAQELRQKTDTAVSAYDEGFAYYRLAQSEQGSPSEQEYLTRSMNSFRQVINVYDDRFAPAYASLANVQFLSSYQTGITPDVNELYEKARSLDPEWSYGYMNQGVNLSYLGNAKDAYGYLKRAVMSNPLFPEQPYIKQQFICTARQLGVEESREFYEEYTIDRNMAIPWCPYK